VDRRADRQAGETNARVTQDLRQALERYALPWLERTSNLAAARDELARQGLRGWAAAVSLELADPARARRHYADALEAADSVKAEELRRWGRANGLEP